MHDYLSELPSHLVQNSELLFELCRSAIEISWMRWPARLSQSISNAGVEEILERFNNLPRASDFFSLFTEEAFAEKAELTACEFQSRSAFGDHIPAEQYAGEYADIRSTPPLGDPRLVTGGSFHLRSNLHGFCTFGRQRSSDPDERVYEKKTWGRRIIVAPRSENRVSRNQMTLQLLSPDFAILHNVSQTNDLFVSPDIRIALGEKKIMKFPFEINLPHQTLLFK